MGARTSHPGVMLRKNWKELLSVVLFGDAADSGVWGLLTGDDGVQRAGLPRAPGQEKLQMEWEEQGDRNVHCDPRIILFLC